MAKTKRREDDELGSGAAGQSGDIQQIPNDAESNSESVEELAEEGNAFEADAIYGVEKAEDPDVSEVTTREVPEDDVPAEYQKDEDEHVA
jgi:N utilization substance protein A